MIKKRIYGSGAIENAVDSVSWRNKMFRELRDNYEFIIPDQLKCPYLKTDIEYGEWVKKNYVLPDMADVASCNHFFVLIDSAYSSGTYAELSLAAWLGKDIVCCLDGLELHELPTWIIGCLHGAIFVKDIDDGIKYYKGLVMIDKL